MKGYRASVVVTVVKSLSRNPVYTIS